MRPLLPLLCVLFTAATSLARAAGPAPADASTLAGHYYLEGGPMEVGSELVLSPAGAFAWSLAYGAADYDVQGTWQRSGAHVVLQPAPSPEPAFVPYRADEYPEGFAAPPGEWAVATLIDEGLGVSEVEVRYESRSGKAWRGLTDLDGASRIPAPAGETWVRTGLRRAGSTAPWQWFDVTPEGTARRAVVFRLTNARDLKHAPFAAMRLRVEPAGLVVEDGLPALRGTYARH